MSGNRGKAYERELKQAFERAGFLAYRNTDSLVGRGKASVKSLPDLWAMRDNGAVLLIEAKVVKGMSIPFNRLAEHQRDYLAEFNEHALSFYGYVSVMYYGEKPRWKRAFLIPISSWLHAEATMDRKSIPLNTAGLLGTELEWKPAVGWIIPTNTGDNK